MERQPPRTLPVTRRVRQRTPASQRGRAASRPTPPAAQTLSACLLLFARDSTLGIRRGATSGLQAAPARDPATARHWPRFSERPSASPPAFAAASRRRRREPRSRRVRRFPVRPEAFGFHDLLVGWSSEGACVQAISRKLACAYGIGRIGRWGAGHSQRRPYCLPWRDVLAPPGCSRRVRLVRPPPRRRAIVPPQPARKGLPRSTEGGIISVGGAGFACVLAT